MKIIKFIKKSKKRRKRYLCVDTEDRRKYLFLPHAKVQVNMKKIAVSGYFDPIHVGHIEYINNAKKLGDWLVVIVNNNNQCVLKKGKFFMDEKDRF